MGLISLFLPPAHSGTYSKDVMLHGAVERTNISGFRGTAFTLQDDNPDHAIYGIQSKERGDQP